MPEYPDHCIRGIRKKDYWFEDTDTVSAALYEPDTRTKDDREDGGIETSINWEDDDKALEFSLRIRDEKNPTQLAFPYGAVRLARKVLDEVNESISTVNTILYERQKLPDNDYHGNIVFKSGVPKHTRTMIATVFAFYSSKPYRTEK
jgi:hypothetical protein